MAKILKSFNFSNVNVKDAICCGFTELKQGTKMDYTFVIEVKWSDSRSTYIKRTYMDFLNLQYNLMNVFPPEKNKSIFGTKKKPLPMLPAVTKSLIIDDIETAEKRELELYKYCKELVSQPKRVIQSQVFQGFFTGRAEDPKPYNPNQKTNIKKMNNNTQQKKKKISLQIDKHMVQFGQTTQLPKKTPITPKSPSYDTKTPQTHFTSPSYNAKSHGFGYLEKKSPTDTTNRLPGSQNYKLYYDEDTSDFSRVSEERVANIYEELPYKDTKTADSKDKPASGPPKARKKLVAPKDLAITPDISPTSTPEQQRHYVTDFI
ncbi:unnamed protein product [Owenia fusiformis]|uniref:Uncharacterized protein n=1 Tax=Owenia fusiformis TaxID=6347 RepID=A0A8J1TV14_OWEFU|nr:unnamed protein product [Owenia fusiformis]